MTGVEVTQADLDFINEVMVDDPDQEDMMLAYAAAAKFRQEARNAALEEAAKVAERSGELSNYSGRGSCCQGLGEDIASAIRAMKEPPCS